jgi:osmoprotectant transport system permease protein
VTALFAAAGPVIPDFGTGSDCVRNNDTFCWTWFQDNWSSAFGPRLIEHIELTLVAVGIGCLIAFAFALIAYRHSWVELPFVFVSGFLYTIPSLALFQLLVPASGLTRLTVEIALVSYTLLILFRNMLIGLRGVPDDVREAARGMGFTPRQTLWRVELPLAMPAIIAGIQIATVTVISLATVGAFVVDEGLGSPIFDAINRGTFKTELIAAAVLAIALGFLAYALTALLQRLLTPWARARTT